MSSTSQKHRDFVGEPMGEKEIYEVAGIGKVLGEKLVKMGFDKVNYGNRYSTLNLNFIKSYDNFCFRIGT